MGVLTKILSGISLFISAFIFLDLYRMGIDVPSLSAAIHSLDFSNLGSDFHCLLMGMILTLAGQACLEFEISFGTMFWANLLYFCGFMFGIRYFENDIISFNCGVMFCLFCLVVFYMTLLFDLVKSKDIKRTRASKKKESSRGLKIVSLILLGLIIYFGFTKIYKNPHIFDQVQSARETQRQILGKMGCRRHLDKNLGGVKYIEVLSETLKKIQKQNSKAYISCENSFWGDKTSFIIKIPEKKSLGFRYAVDGNDLFNDGVIYGDEIVSCALFQCVLIANEFNVLGNYGL